jgi:hypothetical protein
VIKQDQFKKNIDHDKTRLVFKNGFKISLIIKLISKKTQLLERLLLPKLSVEIEKN